MPRSAAASIMYAVACPKSYISQSPCCSSSGSLATKAIVAAEEAMCRPPRSHTFASSRSSSRSVTTTKSHGCQFPADGARRPASQMRSRLSRAIGWLLYWRRLRRARIASHVSMNQSYRTAPPGPHPAVGQLGSDGGEPEPGEHAGIKVGHGADPAAGEGQHVQAGTAADTAWDAH